MSGRVEPSTEVVALGGTEFVPDSVYTRAEDAVVVTVSGMVIGNDANC